MAKRRTPSPADFVARVAKDCKARGVTLRLEAVHRVQIYRGTYCSGYFDSGSKELVVAVARPDWLSILAHEYAHMQQWVEGEFVEDDDSFHKFDQWVAGKMELEDDELTRCVRLIQRCELDAEKRAVEYLRRYRLRKDLADYRRRANAYVLFYEVARRHRRWSDKESPYTVPTVYRQMSTRFVSSLSHITKKFEAAVLKECMGRRKG